MRQIRNLTRGLILAAVLSCVGAAAFAQGDAPAGTKAPQVAKAGATATLRAGVQLRKQPSAIGQAAASEPGEHFVLKASVRNGDGTWWYLASANAPSNALGWALEPDLVVAP